MELFGVSSDDEEFLRLYLEDQFLGCRETDIHYLADNRIVVVSFEDDCKVDNLLKESRYLFIEKKKYRARKLYSAELMGVINAESALPYLRANIGNVVYYKHFPLEQRLVVAFDEVEAIEQLCKQSFPVTKEGAAFRVKRLSKSQQECRQRASQEQQQQKQPTMQSQPQNEQPNWKPEIRRQQQQEHHREQQEYQQEQLHRLQQLVREPQQCELHRQAGDMDLQAKYAVTISGIPENITKPTLELKLTNQSKKWGINYKHVDYNPSAGMAVVSFTATQDVLKVLLEERREEIPWSITVCDDRQTVCDLLGDVVLLVEMISPEFSTEALWCWMKIVVGEFAHTIVYSSNYSSAAALFTYFTDFNLEEVSYNAKTHAVHGHRLHVTAIPCTKRAQPVHLSERVNLNTLQKYLKDSLNGDNQGRAECLKINGQSHTVTIFSNDYAFRHAISQKHMLPDQEFLLAPLFDELGPVISCQQLWKFDDMKRALMEAGVMTAFPAELTVTGFDNSRRDQSLLRKFLSTRSMSGGGEIKKFSCQKGKAVVTFVDSECARRIHQKDQYDGLQLCGFRLSASLRTFDIRDDAHKKQVLLHNIGVASDDSLKYWLWGISDNRVLRIDYVKKNEDTQLCAVAHFERDIDFLRLVYSMTAVTLDRLYVEPEFVSRPRSIVATNIPDGTHRDEVELFFRDFGSVQRVDEIKPKQWIVTFCQSEDADRACREATLFRKGVSLQTSSCMDFQMLPDAKTADQRRRLTLPLNFVDQALVTFALSKRKTALDYLLQPFGSTVSTDEEDGTPAIVCSLSHTGSRYRDILHRWETLQEECLIFFTSFRSMSISLSSNVYEALVTSIRFLSISSKNQQDVLVTSVDRPVPKITVAGSSPAIEVAWSEMQSLIKDISDSVERSKQLVTQVTDPLEESSIKLLVSVGFCKNVRERYTELKVHLDWENRVIRFEGLPEDIAASNEEIKRILSGSSEDTIKGSEAMLELLGKEEIRQFVDAQLKPKFTDTVVWYLKPSIGVCVRGVDSQSTHDAATVIRKQIIDAPIALDADSLQLIADKKWERFSRDIIKKYHDNLVLHILHPKSHRSGAVLQLSCKSSNSESVVEEVQEFIRLHTQKEVFVSLPCIAVEFLTKFMNDSIISHIEKLQSHNLVKFHPVVDSASELAKTGFRIVGNLHGIINARRNLANLIRTHRVSTTQHKISSPGAEQHFKSQETVLNRIGKETKTIICVSSGSDEQMCLHLDESGLLTVSQVSLPCGTELHVLRGDIVQLSCDAIVNPANGELKHSAGLAAAIAEQGGQIILDECAAAVSKYGQLIDGQVCVTAAGALRCKKIIHAVGPQWQGGNRNEENKLFNAVQNSLDAAVKQGLTSIAIPPISSGIFGYPLEKCTRTIVESVIDFCKISPKRPEKVFLVDIKDDGTKHFTQAVDQLLNKTQGADVKARDSASLSAAAPQLSCRTLREVVEPDENSTLLLEASAGQIVGQKRLQCGTKLFVMKGNIVQLTCDVIVNPTDGQLQLGGGLAAVIADKGGSRVRDECAAYIKDRGQLSDGQVCVTAAGFLHCKKIVHAVGPQWHGGTHNEAKKLFNAVQNSLDATLQQGFTSIAIPPISSGLCGYPIENCTRTIVESVANFCNTAAKAPRTIIFIDNKNEGAKYFKKAVDQLISNTNDTAAAAMVQGSPFLFVNVPQTTSTAQGNFNVPGQAALTAAKSPLTIGNTVVELVEGSLVDQKVDVMVNTVGSMLLLDQGVLSRSVGVAAGPALQQYLTDNFKNGLATGQFVSSAGFQLPCQYVFHCSCSEWTSGNANQVLFDLLSQCLREAAQRRVSSIAIPAIGTGQLGFPPKESARITYEAVLQYIRGDPSTSVRHVKIVAHSPPSVIAAYQEQHAAVFRNLEVSASLLLRPTFSRRGRGTVGSDSLLRGRKEEDSFSVVLNICGKDDGIELAKKALDDYCKKSIVECTVPAHENTSDILSGSQFDDLVQQGVEDGAEVTVDHRNGSVIIRSLERSAANSVKLHVQSVIAGLKMERLHQQNVASRFQWQFMEANDQWHDYVPALNAKLEEAFQTNARTFSYKSADGTGYIVNFGDEKDCLKGNTANSAKIKRIVTEQGLVFNLCTKEKYSEEVVPKGSQDYNHVKDAFFKTAKSTEWKIVEIRKIQNTVLREKYRVNEIEVKQNMQGNTKLPIERWLWHGTREEPLQQICKEGFNRSYCGVNGTKYGKGVYFARDSSYSADNQYSVPNQAGLKHLLYCRVLTGEFVCGKEDMIAPPQRRSGSQAKYESTVDNVRDPTVFVVYQDAQAYPQYIVKFR